MADNYLEKKMEEYRQGRYRYVEHRTPSGNKPHTALMPCTLRSAFIIGTNILSPALVACAKALRDTSCRVAFCCSDRTFGSKTAQSAGLQYFPSDNCDSSGHSAFEVAVKAYGSFDVIVKEHESVLDINVCGNKSSIAQSENCPDEIFAPAAARMLVYLSLPQSLDLDLCGNYTVGSDGRLSEIKN